MCVGVCVFLCILCVICVCVCVTFLIMSLISIEGFRWTDGVSIRNTLAEDLFIINVSIIERNYPFNSVESFIRIALMVKS